ncbi:MAG: hypothetical protein KU37_02790 [Sulfuricurvum sp. PC08-66]|nr:MAG: hypothetical protein KU37_02790 [Sulfuricurvum sp. PC08-66]
MIDFAQLPKVAYEEMNQVHAEEVELLNRLEVLLSVPAVDSDAVDAVLEEMMVHTRGHFGNEERLMREVGFPAYPMHQGEHARALNEMQFVIADWRNRLDKVALRSYFLETIPAWLHQHIATMDTMTARFICMHKGC